MPEEWGILKVGPTSCKRVTVKSTLFCSAGLRPSHHRPNSAVNSTSHGTFIICHRRHYAVKGIIQTMEVRKRGPHGTALTGRDVASCGLHDDVGMLPVHATRGGPLRV